MPRFLCLEKSTPLSLMGEDESCVELATTEVRETSRRNSLTYVMEDVSKIHDCPWALHSPAGSRAIKKAMPILSISQKKCRVNNTKICAPLL